MSHAYYMKFKDKAPNEQEFRKWNQRPGKMNKKGEPIYFTEQVHKDACDINKIIDKYDKDGIITHVSNFEAQFGDLSGAEFKEMMDKVVDASNLFMDLPAHIRNEFNNSPEELLTFMDDPDNRDKAIELGLIRNTWTPETDGLGEHVKEGENVEKE
jgi:phage internal scaffolding protein